MSRAPFLRSARLDADAPRDGYPWQLPAVRALAEPDGLVLDRPVTFLVGENGSGKSTLIEALAVATGFNAEGGSKSFRFATRASESELGRHLVLSRAPATPRTGFFLRAESFYNIASEIERLGADLLPAYGGISLHERSHGESFLDVVTHRFGPRGFYLLDEPEAALSVRGTMALLTRLHDLAGQDCQFVVATHSPILLALPGAEILQLDDDGARTVSYDEALPVELTRRFLDDPARSLRYLLD
jgi:predicted ATPase